MIDAVAPDELQALIWLPEQRFWQQSLKSGSKKTDADYEDAAVMVLLEADRADIPFDIYGRMG